MANITTAKEARDGRVGPTLSERVRKDPGRATAIDELVSIASIEHFLQQIMDLQHVSARELANRINVKPPQISRDLHGGLQRATISRVAKLAEALGYEFVPMFIPQHDAKTREELAKTTRRLLAG